jgi:hypothetical protein
MVAASDSRDEYERSPQPQPEEHRPADKGSPVAQMPTEDLTMKIPLTRTDVKLNSLSESKQLRKGGMDDREWRRSLDEAVEKVFGDLFEVLQRLPPSKDGEAFAMFDRGARTPIKGISRLTNYICYGDLSKGFSSGEFNNPYPKKSVFILHTDWPVQQPGVYYDPNTPPGIILEQGWRGPAVPPNLDVALKVVMDDLAIFVPQRIDEIRKGLVFLHEERCEAAGVTFKAKDEAPPKPRDKPVIAPR